MKKPRSALITGASSGIGEAFAKLLADKGVDLILTGRDEKRLEEVRGAVASQVNVEILKGDLTDPSHRQEVVDYIHKHSPDLVVNNAGFGAYGPAALRETALQSNMVELNCKALVELTLEAVKVYLLKGQKGTILNVSSAGAFFPFPYNSVYGATKAFVNSFSESLDAELTGKGVRVLATCPGQVKTRFRHNAGGKGAVSPGGMVMNQEYAAEEMWRQLQRAQGIRIFNWRYRLLCFLAQYFMPRKLLFAILKWNIAKRHPID